MSEEPFLLAKSKTKNGATVSLEDHLLDTESAALAIFSGLWRENWFRFWKIPPEQEERFLLLLRIVCLWHDLGKANNHFLLMLEGKKKNKSEGENEDKFYKQPLTHEHLSAILFAHPAVQKWLSTALSENEQGQIFSAIVNHHLRIDGLIGENKFLSLEKDRQKEIKFYLHDRQIETILDKISSLLSLPSFRFQVFDFEPELEDWIDAKYFVEYLERETIKDNFLGALKSGVILSDAVASGIVRTQKIIDDNQEDCALKIKNWILACQSFLLSPEKIEEDILSKRKALISNFNDYHQFQKDIAVAGPRALLLSSCGSGKSLAAYLWAAEQSKTRKIQNIIFLYPTKGTANEGFKDYLVSNKNSSVIHSGAEYFLSNLQNSPDDPDKFNKLYTLDNWRFNYFSATFDQFLSFLGQSYKGILHIPLLMNSALIIDEIHSLDSQSFEFVLKLLKYFDLPVLGMTASLPTKRKEALKKELKIVDILNPEGDFGRYYVTCDLQDSPIEAQKSKNLAFQKAQKFLNEGKKVLWVVNTVSRCQEISQQIPEALCYHSRFTLGDREERQSKVVELLKSNNSGIVISTQVCEMSLDIDIDLLISEIAPVTSLVQRMGRVSRFNSRGGEVFIYQDPKQFGYDKCFRPYSKTEINTAKKFAIELSKSSDELSKLPEPQKLKNCTLIQKMEETFSKNNSHLFVNEPNISGHFWSQSEEVREIERETMQVIMHDQFIAEAKNLFVNKKPIDKYIISLPFRQKFSIEDPQNSKFPKHIKIVSNINYNKQLGALI